MFPFPLPQPTEARGTWLRIVDHDGGRYGDRCLSPDIVKRLFGWWDPGGLGREAPRAVRVRWAPWQ